MSATATVVGSGPNGLAAALTLAMAGVEVTVYEGADRIGGGTRSSELTEPGLLHDECSGFHPLSLDTAFSRLARLEEAGLRWAWPEVQYSHPLDGGGGGTAYRSVTETSKGLGADEPGWGKVFGPLVDRFDAVTEDFLQPVVGIPSHPVQLARFGFRAGLPAAVLARRFATDTGKALFAGVAAHAMWPFRSVLSSAIGTALGTAAHRYGWPVAVGGSASITTAMARQLEAHGGVIETGRPVRSASELAPTDLLMLDVAPSAAIQILGDKLPSRVRSGLTRYRHGPAVFKVDFAVDGGVPWEHEPTQRAGTVHVGGSYEEVAAAELMVHHGVMPERPFVLVGQQYLADPGRSAGDLHPLYAYAHVPAGFTGDATDVIERQIERFAPGFRDRIVARHVQSATDLAESNHNYVGGDILNGANSPRQLVFRPRIGLNPYSLGVPGNYICSAATPPGAGAHGMCGYNAARAALDSIGLDSGYRNRLTGRRFGVDRAHR